MGFRQLYWGCMPVNTQPLALQFMGFGEGEIYRRQNQRIQQYDNGGNILTRMLSNGRTFPTPYSKGRHSGAAIHAFVLPTYCVYYARANQAGCTPQMALVKCAGDASRQQTEK